MKSPHIGPRAHTLVSWSNVRYLGVEYTRPPIYVADRTDTDTLR